jgi:Carboxypeptidase regulatory-like domain
MRRRISKAALYACSYALVLAGLGTSVAAQTQSGEVFGRVVDQTGAVLPGVSVTLSGSGLITSRDVVSQATGGYRFPNVPVGTYSVSFALPGFATLVREGIRIETGFNAEINVQLRLSTQTETITVSGEAPIVDTRSTTTGQTFTREMLERIPSARDPWVVMEQTPGIIMDRQNVGGNQSGQQSSFITRGTGNNEVWNVDGGNITDMAASSSSMYFDFDAFEEIQIQTGGSDASVQSSGVSVNLVTRSGGNRFRGSSRFYLVDDALQGNNITPDLQAQGAGSGNPIRNIQDYGAEIGGPIVRNKAWFWNSFGAQDIEVGVVGFVRPGGDPNNRADLVPDVTTLKTYNGKLQYQITARHKSSFLFTFNDKSRGTRGAGPLNPPETTFKQISPVAVYKLSHQWIPTSRLSFDVQAMAMPDGGFLLDVQDPALSGVQATFDIATQINGRSARRQDNRRPQTEARLDGNYYLPSWLGGDHSLKFGVGWRDTPSGFTGTRGGGATARFTNGVPTEADLYRDSETEYGLYQVYGYLQNAYKRGRLTVNGGLRFDLNDDKALRSLVAANPILPDRLPAVQFEGADPGVAFFNWSPRAGLIWDLTGDGKTVAKMSGAIYWGTGITAASFVNPVSEVSLRFPWADLNGDRFVQRNELDLTRLLSFTGNYDPLNPASPRSSNTVDPNLRNDRTDEFTVGLERELLPAFSVGAQYIYRNYPRYGNFTYRLGAPSEEYVPVTLTFPCGNASCREPQYSVTYFELPFQLPGVGERRNQGFARQYHGVELTARKRFGNRWMLNASANVQTTTGHYQGPNVGYQDPTDIAQLDGAQTGTANARWIGKLTGLYVLPWQDIGISGFLNMRDGYPFNRVVQTANRRGGLGRADVDIDRWGDVRYDDFYQVDLRLEKQFGFGRWKGALALDVFNVWNAATVLDRQERQNITTANNVQEVLAPRVGRVGLRFSF